MVSQGRSLIRTCTLAGMAVIAFILALVEPAFAAKFDSTYNQILGLPSRKVIWFIAQMHLYMGSFVLAIPMFVVVIEYVGFKSKSKKFDDLAYEFCSLLSVAYAVTAALGGTLAFALMTLYPTFWGFMSSMFKDVMWIYALLFFGETFTLYIYYYGWHAFTDYTQMIAKKWRMVFQTVGWIGTVFGFLFTIDVKAVMPYATLEDGSKHYWLTGDQPSLIGCTILLAGVSFLLINHKKGFHIFLGVWLNIFGTWIMYLANSWASFMMSPVGVDEAGQITISAFEAVINPLWGPVAVHRLLGNLAFGGFVGGAYAAVKFIGSSSAEEKAHYDWMGYVSNFVGLCGLIPLPFAGYYLGRQVYSNSAVMGNNMMGGDFSWTFIIQAMLVGGLFLVSTYYLWSGMCRIPGSERYHKWFKFLLGALVISFMTWLTPHNMPLSGEESAQMGGGQFHPVLKFAGLMPAKNAVVNMIILSTFFSFVLYRRGNKKDLVPISKQGRAPYIAIPIAGAICIALVGQYGYYLYTLDPATLDLPDDEMRRGFFQMAGMALFTNNALVVIACILALVFNKPVAGQYVYLFGTGAIVTGWFGYEGFLVMEKASPFLRNVAVSQFLELISCIILVVTIDIFAFKDSKEIAPIQWGKIPERSQYALIALTILIAFNMGLMGFIRSGLRVNWHIFGVMEDTSQWSFTLDNMWLTMIVSTAVFCTLSIIAFGFWLSNLAHPAEEHGADESPEALPGAAVEAPGSAAS